MTRIVEAIAPCVLHADEVEKGIGGVESSAHTDSGTTARVFGHLLTWLQEARASFFLVGTANRPELIPPEFLRRLDAVWRFDVPAPDERRQIWEIHLRKRGRDPERFDLAHLIAESEGYTGAEIEKAVKQALRRAFLDGDREPGAADLAAVLREAEPIRTSHAERLDQARRSLRGLEKPTILRDRVLPRPLPLQSWESAFSVWTRPAHGDRRLRACGGEAPMVLIIFSLTREVTHLVSLYRGGDRGDRRVLLDRSPGSPWLHR